MAAITSPARRGTPNRGRHLRVVAAGERIARRPSAATYRRRRVAALVLVLALLMLGEALVGWLGSGPLSAPEPVAGVATQPVGSASYVVRPGDTLWSIARRLQPSGDIRPLVQDLAAQLGDAPLRVGQRLDLGAP